MSGAPSAFGSSEAVTTPDDLTLRILSSCDPCPICHAVPHLTDAGRLDMTHDYRRHHPQPLAQQTEERRQPKRQPTRIFGERDE